MLLVCVQGYQEKSQKAPEHNNVVHCESDIVGAIRKSGEEMNVDVSRNGDRGVGVGSAVKQLSSVSCVHFVRRYSVIFKNTLLARSHANSL